MFSPLGASPMVPKVDTKERDTILKPRQENNREKAREIGLL